MVYCCLACDVDSVGSHELYIYANTLDMYENFAPKLKGRYLSSNVNITVAGRHGKPVSVPVGGMPTNGLIPVVSVA